VGIAPIVKKEPTIPESWGIIRERISFIY